MRTAVATIATVLAVVGLILLIRRFGHTMLFPMSGDGALENPDAGFAFLHALDTGFWRPAAERAGYRAPFYDTAPVEWCRRLRAAWRDIRDEYDRVGAPLPVVGDVIAHQAALSGSSATDDGGGPRWRACVLRFYGLDTAHAARFPRTMAHVRRAFCAARTEPPSLIMFSVLDPGRQLPTHRGPNHGLLRYHLALRVPAAPGGLTVAGVLRPWTEGADLLFDDTLPHSAANLSVDTPRVVLFLDVPRPMPHAPIADLVRRWAHRRETGLFARHPAIRATVARIDEVA